MDFQCPIAMYSDYKEPRSQDPDSEEQCTWAGPLQQLRHHCTTHHTVFQIHYEIAPKIGRGVTICIPFIGFDELFLFKQHYVELREEVFWSLQIVGDPDHASRYAFIVTLRSPVVSRFFKYKKQCQSILLKDEDLVSNEFGMPRANIIVPECATLDHQHRVHVEILQVQEKRMTFDLRSRNL